MKFGSMLFEFTKVYIGENSPDGNEIKTNQGQRGKRTNIEQLNIYCSEGSLLRYLY